MKKVLLTAAAVALASFGFNANTSLANAQIKGTRGAASPDAVNGTPLSSEGKKAEAGKSTDKASDKAIAANESRIKKDNAETTPKANVASTTTTAVTASPAPESKSVETNAPVKNTSLPPIVAAHSSVALSNLYRVAAGDVLDIRLQNSPSRESTLFTVLADGTIDYPLAGEPSSVNGLTPEEIGERLTSKIKIFEKAQFVVSVRDYASHNVIVTGLVDNPGARILRREAVPLYVVLAEAQPRLEAVRATIARAGSQVAAVDLTDQTAMTTLVMPGDFIKVMAAPPPVPQFYFIGGQVGAPGQKDFHAGLTLTQAVLASGGTTPSAGSKVKVSRQGADGRLVSTEYNLKQIADGKLPDPALQPGDRIEIERKH